MASTATARTTGLSEDELYAIPLDQLRRMADDILAGRVSENRAPTRPFDKALILMTGRKFR